MMRAHTWSQREQQTLDLFEGEGWQKGENQKK